MVLNEIGSGVWLLDRGNGVQRERTSLCFATKMLCRLETGRQWYDFMRGLRLYHHTKETYMIKV